MITCYLCKGPVRVKTIDYMAHTPKGYVLVRNLSAEVCDQCGEIYLDIEANKKIDESISHAGQAKEHLDVPVVTCA